jgi:arginine dihydrolase
MVDTCDILMTEPSSYEVSYVINPWMRPARWSVSRDLHKKQSMLCWKQLHHALNKFGARICLMDSVPELPDLVFPANAAIVLDRKVLLSRFAHQERRREEPVFRSVFHNLMKGGIVSEVDQIPSDLCQEGAGDCLWDRHRKLFWAGYGQRSMLEASGEIERFFGCEVQSLELVDPHFYHLDVAMAILENGEVIYYAEAFSPASQLVIQRRIPSSMRIEVSRAEAVHFNINVISLFGVIFMTRASTTLRWQLMSRGYTLCELDLSPFLLAGGAAACLTLRLDYTSRESEYFQGRVVDGQHQ